MIPALDKTREKNKKNHVEVQTTLEESIKTYQESIA
jgi:hypothetical protein